MGKKLKEVTVSLPWLSGTWAVDDAQRRAAWEIYVELVTRISVEPLGKTEGLLREALASLYSLFGETRRILRAYGPDVAIPEKKRFLSLGQIAVDILNQAIRPFLAKWHPALAEHEAKPHPDVTNVEHERSWGKATELRDELEKLRTNVVHYADVLAEACNVAPLHRRTSPEAARAVAAKRGTAP